MIIICDKINIVIVILNNFNKFEKWNQNFSSPESTENISILALSLSFIEKDIKNIIGNFYEYLSSYLNEFYFFIK